MAKLYTRREAKDLILLHRDTITSLRELNTIEEKLQNDIKWVIDRIIENAVDTELKGIPTEELNAGKQGIRVKLLTENGYNNLSDISKANVSRLSYIKGIGKESAMIILGITQDIRANIKKGIKLKLSVDDQTPDKTELIRLLSRLIQFKPLFTEIAEIVADNAPLVIASIEAMEQTNGFFKNIFASRATKEAADDAYLYLQNEFCEGYVSRANDILDYVKQVNNQTPSESWQHFTTEPVVFFNYIEKIYPKALGNDDGQYGLPKDLSELIGKQDCALEGLKCELRGYQRWGVKYALHQKRILLGDEMGLGKTIQAIAVMVSLRNAGGTHFVVVCPAGVMTNWEREISSKSDLKVFKLHGADRQAAYDIWLEDGGVALTTYEMTSALEIPEDLEIAMVVVDEAHFIKNPEAKRTINTKRICEHSGRLLFMTGTALENRVDEMIELIGVLNPEIAERIKPIRQISTAPEFRKLVAPVYYRRKRDEVLTELPDKIENAEWCSLLPEEMAAYEQAVLSRDFINVRRVSWNVDTQYSSKAIRLKELVEEAKNDNRKIIVFSFFLDTLEKVSALFGDECMDVINGSVAPARRQEIIDEFDRAGAGAVLPAQIQSGGTGLNIQSASVVVLCEPQLKPSIENQAISRAYRMGQTRNVLVYRLLCENTIDEKMVRLLEQKQAVFNAFADKSDSHEIENIIDEKSFSDILEEEIARINQKG